MGNNKTKAKTTKVFKETANANNEVVNSSSYADWDAAVEAQAEKWRQQGKTVSYARDNNGALHATTLGEDRAKEIANSYNTGASSTYNIGGKTYNVSAGQTAAEQQAALAAAEQTGYDNAMAQYQNIYSTQQADTTAALQNAYTANAEQINTNYDNAARNYYQLYKTQQAQLPENLSKLGVTGGASESAQIDLLNTYSNNLYNNESNRNNQLANANQNYNDKIAENSANVANSMASAYLQMAQQQLQYQREDEQAAAEKQAAAEETAAAKKIEEHNNRVRNRISQQLVKGDTIWTWTDNEGYLHWTTYQSLGLAYGGTELSGSNYKKKIVSDSSSSNNTKYSKKYQKKKGGDDDDNGSGGGNDDKEVLYNYSYTNPFQNEAITKNNKANAQGGPTGNLTTYNKILTKASNLLANSMTAPLAVQVVKNAEGLNETQKKKILKQLGLL